MSNDILFIGDPHGEWLTIVERVLRHRPSAIVLLGDMDLERPLEVEMAKVIDAGIEIHWIPGNHDGDRDHWHDYLFESALADRNLNARVVEIAGLKVAGLGGVFRGRIWHPLDQGPQPRWRRREDYLATLPKSERWREGIPRAHRASVWFEDYELLWDQRADILVTHEAPTSLIRDGRQLGFEVLDDLGAAMGARLIHGHHHHDYDSVLPNGVLVGGVGIAGVMNQHGQRLEPGLRRDERTPLIERVESPRGPKP